MVEVERVQGGMVKKVCCKQGFEVIKVRGYHGLSYQGRYH